LQVAKSLPVLGIGDDAQRAVARRCFFEKIPFRKPNSVSRRHDSFRVIGAKGDATRPDPPRQRQVDQSGHPQVKTRSDSIVVQPTFPKQQQQWSKRPWPLDHSFVEPAPYILPPIF